MQVQSYLFFEGRCEEAIEFYKNAIGAKVEMMMRFGESPEPAPPGTMPPGTQDKIMHASLRIGESTLMASDGYCQSKPAFEGFALSLSPKTQAEAQRLFSGLVDGGQVKMALTKTFWSPCFGMLVDRFGVSWMINVMAEA